MGCGASVPKECTPEQKAAICAEQGKEMMLISVLLALKQNDQIKIVPPPQVNDLKADIANLRLQAAEARKNIVGDAPAAAAAPAPAAAEAAPAAGGMLGGMAAGLASLQVKADAAVNTAATAAAGVIATGAETVLLTLADQLEKVVNAIEEPFTKIGQDLVKEKEESLKKICSEFIVKLPMTEGAVLLVRGAAPHGKPEYDAVDGGALTNFLCGNQKTNFVAALAPDCEEAIKKHTVTKSWDAMIENYNSVAKKLEAIEFCKTNNIVLKPVELDIKDYIVSQTVDQLGLLMAKEEAAFRKEPAKAKGGMLVDKDDEFPRQPITFKAVFSGEPLNEVMYNNKDK